MKIWKEFFFEAAHYLNSAPSDHPNARIHGHSFRVRVTLNGEPAPSTGLIMHFSDLEEAMKDIKDQLDHRLLNEIEGLQTATLETITRWIWDQAKPKIPTLCEVAVSRDSCMEGCVYNGPSQSA